MQFHKFQPKGQPGQAAQGASPAETSNQGTSSNGISATAVQQILALQQEKASRTPAQQKVDSNVLFTIRMMAGQPAAPGVPFLYTGVDLDTDNRVVVDIVANVTDELLAQLTACRRSDSVYQSSLAQHTREHSSTRNRIHRCVAGRNLHLSKARLTDRSTRPDGA